MVDPLTAQRRGRCAVDDLLTQPPRVVRQRPAGAGASRPSAPPQALSAIPLRATRPRRVVHPHVRLPMAAAVGVAVDVQGGEPSFVETRPAAAVRGGQQRCLAQSISGAGARDFQEDRAPDALAVPRDAPAWKSIARGGLRATDDPVPVRTPRELLADPLSECLRRTGGCCSNDAARVDANGDTACMENRRCDASGFPTTFGTLPLAVGRSLPPHAVTVSATTTASATPSILGNQRFIARRAASALEPSVPSAATATG